MRTQSTGRNNYFLKGNITIVDPRPICCRAIKPERQNGADPEADSRRKVTALSGCSASGNAWVRETTDPELPWQIVARSIRDAGGLFPRGGADVGMCIGALLFSQPFLERRRHGKHRVMCALYIAALSGPGDRKNIEPLVFGATNRSRMNGHGRQTGWSAPTIHCL